MSGPGAETGGKSAVVEKTAATPRGPEDSSGNATKNRKLARAREFGAKVRGWISPRNQGGEGRTPEAALQTLSTPEDSNGRTSADWKRATRRSGIMRLRRQIDPAVDAWRRETPARRNKVTDKFNASTENGTKPMSRQDILKAYSNAIAETMHEEGFDVDVVKNQKKVAEAKNKPRTKREIKANPEVQTEINKRLDILTAEKGRKLSLLEARRVKNLVVEATLKADRDVRAAEVKNAQDEQEARLATHDRDDFGTNFAEKFSALNPSGKELSAAELADFKATALKNTEDHFLQQDKNAADALAAETERQRTEDEAAARTSGEYNAALAHLLLNSDITDSAELQKRAMEAAILKMKGGSPGEAAAGPEARGTAKPGPDAAAAVDSGDTTLEVAGTEAGAAEPGAIDTKREAAQGTEPSVVVQVDISTEAGRASLIKLADAFRAESGEAVDLKKIDPQDPIWKQFIEFLLKFGIELITNTPGAVTETVTGAVTENT